MYMITIKGVEKNHKTILNTNISSGSDSSYLVGGAPKAAEGGLLAAKVEGNPALGLGKFLGRWPLLIILGGCSGLGAASGVLGMVEKVFTVTISGVVFPPRVLVLLVGGSRRAKSNKQEIASRSRSSSYSTLALKFLMKGDSDLGLTLPLPGLRLLHVLLPQ